MGYDLGYPIGFVAKLEFAEDKIRSLPTEDLLSLIPHISKQKLLLWKNKEKVFELVKSEFKSRLPKIESDELISLFTNKRFIRKDYWEGFDLRNVMAKEIVSRKNIDGPTIFKLYENEHDFRVLEVISKDVGQNPTINSGDLFYHLKKDNNNLSGEAALDLLRALLGRDDIEAYDFTDIYCKYRRSDSMRFTVRSILLQRSDVSKKRLDELEETIQEVKTQQGLSALRSFLRL